MFLKTSFCGFFGNNKAFGVLTAAALGVPLYACGGGTIPLLHDWMLRGMSMGSAAAFMVSGPATKITNLGAVKLSSAQNVSDVYYIQPDFCFSGRNID